MLAYYARRQEQGENTLKFIRFTLFRELAFILLYARVLFPESQYNIYHD